MLSTNPGKQQGEASRNAGAGPVGQPDALGPGGRRWRSRVLAPTQGANRYRSGYLSYLW